MCWRNVMLCFGAAPIRISITKYYILLSRECCSVEVRILTNVLFHIFIGDSDNVTNNTKEESNDITKETSLIISALVREIM